jgi:large subunit ribosomal protein L30
VAAKKKLRLTQFKSANGTNPKQKDTLRTLGLGKIGRTSERPDDPTVRGALDAVSHLVKVEQ